FERADSKVKPSAMSSSNVTLERLGNGAAFLVQDESTGKCVLLGCGEVKGDSVDAKDDASGYESAESVEELGDRNVGAAVRQYARELRDCVKREGDGQASALVAVLITDYRPEASFMLPYLTEKTAWGTLPAPANAPPGTPPPAPPTVFMTHGTRAIAPHVLTEYWMGTYGKSKDKAGPYDANDITNTFLKTTPLPLKATITVNEHVKVTAYHSGHVAGGCSYLIEFGATSVLFVNGFNLSGGRVLLPAEIPRCQPCAMITSSSFAVSVSETRTSMERDLMRALHECLSADGKVVIPVFHLGFFQELMTIVLQYLKQMQFSCPVYVADNDMEYPNRFHTLLKRTYTPGFRALDPAKINAVKSNHRVFDWKQLQEPGAFILFTSPANISQGDSFRAIKALASDPKNLIVLSEYCTPGTVNYTLYADPQRKEINKRLGVTVSCGVHYFPCGDEVDAKSIVELARLVSPRQVFLDYVVPEDMQFVKAHIIQQLKTAPDMDGLEVNELTQEAPTTIQAARDIPVRIHKSMFNNPSDVSGLLITEGKRKLMLVTASNGARRLKKKKHSLQFSCMWKRPPESMPRTKKRAARAPSSALSFLLSAAAESADEEETEEQPTADVNALITAVGKCIEKWILDVRVEWNERFVKVRSVGVSVTPEWEVQLEWMYEDEELAGRVLGLAKQVINAEYVKALEQ
ncbi:TPA: hypothetical protein N0F65_001792, partial [Lagenidium giganteum]